MVTQSEAQQSFFVYVKDVNTGVIKKVAFTSDIQVGSTNTIAMLTLFGGFALNAKQYVTSITKESISVSSSDSFVNVYNDISRPISVNLPGDAKNGQIFFVKDASGTAFTNTIDIYPPSGLIEGDTKKSITSNYGSMIVYFQGNQWYVIATGGSGGGADSDAEYVLMSSTPTLPNSRTLVAGTNISITDSGPGGSVTINSTAAADSNPSFVTLSTTSSLSNERVLTPGYGIQITDNGPGSSVVVSALRGSADVSASYLTITNTGSLPNERALAAGGNISFSDGGAGGSLTIDLTQALGLANAGTFIYPTVTADRYGRITAITPGITPAPTTATYIVVSQDPTLTNERNLVGGNGIKTQDLGAGSTFTLSINDGVVATVSGTTFTGNIRAPIITATTGFSGAISKLTSGASLIVAGANIQVTTSSSGQIIIDSNATITASVDLSNLGVPDISASYITIANTGSLPNERALAVGNGLLLTDNGAGSTVSIGINNNVIATVSGTTFTGAVRGPAFTGGLTGSLWVLPNSTSAFIAGTNISITSQSNGQLRIDGTTAQVSGSDVFAPLLANYVLIGNTGTLPNERALVAGTGITITDNGANSSVVITSLGTDVSASYVTIGNTGSLPNERALTAGFGISITDNGAGSSVSIAVNGNAVGADVSASYVTIGNTGSLPNERALIAGTGLLLSDGGAGNSVSLRINDGVVATVSGTTFTGNIRAPIITATTGFSGALYNLTTGQSYLVAGPENINITTQSNGQVVISVTAADKGANYLLVGNTGSLQNERALNVSNALTTTDTGANASFIIGINDGVIATVSGTAFTGPISSPAVTATTLTGSLTRLFTGASYLVAGSSITILTQSNGQVLISAASTLADFDWVDGGTKIRSTSSVSISSDVLFANDYGTDNYFFVSGSRNVLIGPERHISVFGGDVFVSGSLRAVNITGSLQTISTGQSYLVAGFDMSITTASNGQVTITSAGPSSLASFITVGGEASLANERVLTAGANITITDNGPGSSIVIAGTGTGGGGGGGGTINAAGYYGFTSSSNAYTVQGVWTAIGNATDFTDVMTQSISRVSSIFTLANAGLYGLNASFNVYGNESYVSLRLSSSNGISLERTTYRAATIDQVPVTLAGIFSASANKSYVIEYLTSGTVLPWTSSNPQQDGTNMITGEVSIFSLGGTGGGGITGSVLPPTPPQDATYLTLTNHSMLTDERMFVAGIGLLGVDAGANNTFTLGVNDGVVATVSGTRFTGPVTASLGLIVSGNLIASGGMSGSLQKLADGVTNYLIGSGTISVTTSSVGQIIIAPYSSGATPIWVPPNNPHTNVDDEFDSTVLSSSWIFRDTTNSATRTPTSSTLTPYVNITGSTTPPNISLHTNGRKSHLLVQTSVTGPPNYIIVKPFVMITASVYYTSFGCILDTVAPSGGGITSVGPTIRFGIFAANAGIPDFNNYIAIGIRDNASTPQITAITVISGAAPTVNNNNTISAGGAQTYPYFGIENVGPPGTPSWNLMGFNDAGQIAYYARQTPLNIIPAYIGWVVQNSGTGQPAIFSMDFIRESAGHPLFTKQ